GHEHSSLEFVCVFANASATNVLEINDPGQLLAVDAIRIVDHTVGIGNRQRLGAEIKQLLDCVLRNVAAARNQAELPFQRILAALQHFSRKVDAAVTGGFRTNERTAPVQALAG